MIASRDAAGRILLNGGAVGITGGKPTVANTSLLEIFGQDGDDVITLDEAMARCHGPSCSVEQGTIPSPPDPAPMNSLARTAMTRCWARATCCSAAPATMC